MGILQLVRVSKNINREVVLSSVDLDLDYSSIVLVRGRSGVGKTTLAKIASLLLRPDSGKVLFNGIDTWSSRRIRDRIRLRCIGYIDQDYTLLPELTVWENIELPLVMIGMSKEERKRVIRDTMDMLGLSGLEFRYPSELSGGQRQRVAIARAIVKKPLVIVGDEPFSNLDDETIEVVMNYFKLLARDLGIGFLITTVDLHGDYNADKEYFLERGFLKRIK
ncbi:MAG: ATP-binding cassette domain-containing protein [Desulfurococcaceae archaeon]